MGCREQSMLNVFYIATPSLGPPVSQLCLICSRGPWKCETAPPGRAVLTARWFVRQDQRCDAKHGGGRDRQTRRVERGEKCTAALSSSSSHPDPALFHFEGSFTLKSAFTVLSEGLPGQSQTPPSPKPKFIHLRTCTSLQRPAACWALRQHMK